MNQPAPAPLRPTTNRAVEWQYETASADAYDAPIPEADVDAFLRWLDHTDTSDPKLRASARRAIRASRA